MNGVTVVCVCVCVCVCACISAFKELNQCHLGSTLLGRLEKNVIKLFTLWRSLYIKCVGIKMGKSKSENAYYSMILVMFTF